MALPVHYGHPVDITVLQVLQLMCHEHAGRVSQQTADHAVEEAATDGLHIEQK